MKDISKPFCGLNAFLPTPTTANGEVIDVPRLRSLIDEMIAAGVTGVTVFGSTGSNGSFTEDERKLVVSVAVEHVAKRVPLIAGTGAITTSETVRFSKYAASAGADAVIVVPLTYVPLKEHEVEEHYTEIAKSVDIPLGIYNNPSNTGVDIKPEQIGRLARIDTVAFVKEGSGSLQRIIQIHELTEHSISVVNGWDALMMEAEAVGVDGWFSGASNILPRECVKLYALAAKGDLAAARSEFLRLHKLFAMGMSKGTLRVAHSGMHILGRSVGEPRKPIRSLGQEDTKALEKVLIELDSVRARDKQASAA